MLCLCWSLPQPWSGADRRCSLVPCPQARLFSRHREPFLTVDIERVEPHNPPPYRYYRCLSWVVTYKARCKVSSGMSSAGFIFCWVSLSFGRVSILICDCLFCGCSLKYIRCKFMGFVCVVVAYLIFFNFVFFCIVVL